MEPEGSLLFSLRVPVQSRINSILSLPTQFTQGN
jgi:hypothetical protein